MDVEKLRRMAGAVRTGGKGSVRRKKKAVHKATTTDDKKLQSTLKRIGVNSIPAIEEVNIFKDDHIIQFINPKVQASIAANTWVVSGSPQTKKLQDLLPGIINQLGTSAWDFSDFRASVDDLFQTYAQEQGRLSEERYRRAEQYMTKAENFFTLAGEYFVSERSHRVRQEAQWRREEEHRLAMDHAMSQISNMYAYYEHLGSLPDLPPFPLPGPDNLEHLKRLAEHLQKQAPAADPKQEDDDDDDDDVPELVPGETFEAAAAESQAS